MVPELMLMTPVLTKIISELIVRVSPELILKDDIVHVLIPSQVPPIATHEGLSETIPLIAYAFSEDTKMKPNTRKSAIIMKLVFPRPILM